MAEFNAKLASQTTKHDEILQNLGGFPYLQQGVPGPETSNIADVVDFQLGDAIKISKTSGKLERYKGETVSGEPESLTFSTDTATTTHADISALSVWDSPAKGVLYTVTTDYTFVGATGVITRAGGGSMVEDQDFYVEYDSTELESSSDIYGFCASNYNSTALNLAGNPAGIVDMYVFGCVIKAKVFREKAADGTRETLDSVDILNARKMKLTVS